MHDTPIRDQIALIFIEIMARNGQSDMDLMATVAYHNARTIIEARNRLFAAEHAAGSDSK